MTGLSERIGPEVAAPLLAEIEEGEAALASRRQGIEQLRERLATVEGDASRRLAELADFLAPKSVWIVGGDGWAFDIGFGGLDHVLAMDRDVNVLVLDTEVYSNTGGQASKATPLAAAAKFAVAGKGVPKKDLGMLAMSYGHVYVASIAFGAKDQQTVRAFVEAASYPGPSLILANSHCIAHGYDLSFGAEHQKAAVESGAWSLFRYDPRLRGEGKNPLPGRRLSWRISCAKRRDFAWWRSVIPSAASSSLRGHRKKWCTAEDSTSAWRAKPEGGVAWTFAADTWESISSIRSCPGRHRSSTTSIRCAAWRMPVLPRSSCTRSSKSRSSASSVVRSNT